MATKPDKFTANKRIYLNQTSNLLLPFVSICRTLFEIPMSSRPSQNRQKPRRTHVSLIIETLHMHEPTPVYQSPYSYFFKLRVSSNAICPSTGRKQGKIAKLPQWQ